jgi:hypothetical protein
MTMASIIDLPKLVEGLKQEDKELFDRFFLVCETTGKLFLTEEMKPWADKTFGDHNILSEQKLVKVMNQFSCEESIFNEIRAKRPMEVKPSDEAMKEIGTSCEQFCKPEQSTPTEEIGRIKGKFCITAANVTKFETHHGLVIFNKHNPLESNEEELLDYMETAKRWFEATHKKNKDAIYPFLMWNCLWRAGASINHGHMQALLGECFHHTEAELFKRVKAVYKKKFKADYFTDIHRVHEALGLGLRSGKVMVYTSMTPRKDKEVMVIADSLDEEYMKAVAKVATCLIKEMGVESFNMGMLLPPMKKDRSWSGFPVITRFVDRGKLGRKGSEIAGVEYIARRSVVEVDPYKVIEKLKTYF